MPLIQVVPTKCDKCGQVGFWDNRVDKKNPKGPDFKCKNKACGEGLWLKKGHVWSDADDDVQVVTTFKGPSTAPATTTTSSTGALVPKGADVAAHWELIADCAIRWGALVKELGAHQAAAADLVGSATFADLAAVAATIAIGRQRRGQ